MRAHQKYAGEQQRRELEDKAGGNADHEEDFEILDQTDEARLVIFVGELTSGGREQQEGQNEYAADHGARSLCIEPTPLGRAIGSQGGEGELEDVVVRGATELGQKERQETPLAQ